MVGPSRSGDMAVLQVGSQPCMPRPQAPVLCSCSPSSGGSPCQPSTQAPHLPMERTLETTCKGPRAEMETSLGGAYCLRWELGGAFREEISTDSSGSTLVSVFAEEDTGSRGTWLA